MPTNRFRRDGKSHRSFPANIQTLFARWLRIGQEFTRKHSRAVEILVFTAAALVLLVACMYGAIHASYQMSNNSDFLIAPFMFKNFHLHNIVLPGFHSNILLYPLYVLQALLPYNYTTLSVVNIGLIVVTILWWSYLLVRIFGKKYLPIVCITTACIIVGANFFMANLVGNTIRNIEYPLALSFILIVNDILKSRRLSRSRILLYGLVTLLFGEAVAGDSLLMPAVVLPIGIVIFFYWLQSRRFTISMWKALGVIFASIIFGAITKKLVASTGIVSLYFDPAFAAHTLPTSTLSFSITTTLQQILKLHNAYIFGESGITPSLVILFVDLSVLFAAIIGFALVVRQTTLAYRKGDAITKDTNFIAAVLAVSFFILPVAYILLGQTATILHSGALIDSGHARYLTYMPLLTIAGLVFLLQRYYDDHKSLLMLTPIVLLLVMAVSSSLIRTEQNTQNLQAQNMRTSINEVVAAAHKNHLSVLLTGYWYGASVRFYSKDTVQPASVYACGQPRPTVTATRMSWYVPSPSVRRSGILVDTTGPDKPFMDCVQELPDEFGKPDRIVYLDGVQEGVPSLPLTKHHLQLWLYHYDVRTKLSTGNLNYVIQSH